MNTKTSNKTTYSIKEACETLELSPVYVRRMIQKGVIKTNKVEIAKNTFKHEIEAEEIERWRNSIGNRSKREDGRLKFTLYASQDELQQIQKLLEDNTIEALIQRSNKVKAVEEAE
jgi:hypothetical protein